MSEIGTDIKKARTLLEEGKLVSIPTETVYGLGGNALNIQSVTAIFKVKNRPFFDPLIVHTSSLEKALPFVQNVPDELFRLAEEFWPGPLTLLLPKRDLIPDLVTAGMDRVGIRVPKHKLTQSLLESLNFPLAAPSANPFGYISPTQATHVNELLGSKIYYILDGGQCQVGIESTIVGLDNGKIVIYREGGVSKEQMSIVLNRQIDALQTGGLRPATPGTMKSHYAPKKKLIAGDLGELLKRYQGKDVGLITFDQYYPQIRGDYQVTLSPTGNIDEAAQNLFAGLRRLDQQPINTILAEYVPNKGLGRAINDRLKRASLN